MTDSTTPRAAKKLMPALVSVRRMISNVPQGCFDQAELEAAATRSLELGGFFDPPVVKRDGENYQVLSGHFEFHAAAIAKMFDPQAGETIPAFIVETEIPAEISKTVPVDRSSLAMLNSEIGDLVSGLATLERAAFNLEACEQFWESGLTHEQILDRLQYLHARFWDELPKGGLVELNARSINVTRMLRTLTDFALRWITI
ncbi:hypothetical protein Q5692_33715 [Microcoleus sp. C2C3]|uniref:hypothetical protein n=1 Tax=unclassified Microcoleus TaxID=2642155 RepID=UPI002FD5CDC4